jgi:hypothetical protein
MYVHLNGSDGRYAVESYDLAKKTITTRYKTVSFNDIRLIKQVFSKEDILLEKAILESRIVPVKYKVVLIPKKSGGVREVYSLEEPFNSEQKKKVKELKLKMLSVKESVALHKGAKTIINLDIEKAFNSIVLGESVIIKDDVLKYSFHKDGFLMQGTPCSSWIFEQVLSPIFTSMVLPFDGLTITRYVDDITISSKKKLSTDIIQKIIQFVSNYMFENGFKINQTKTRSSYDNGKGFKILGIALSQDRLGVRNMKKQAILYWKKGEFNKAEGMLAYLKSYLDIETYNNLKSKFAVKYIDKSNAMISTDLDLPF